MHCHAALALPFPWPLVSITGAVLANCCPLQSMNLQETNPATSPRLTLHCPGAMDTWGGVQS